MDVTVSLLSQINMMLANLYRKAGQERSAVTSYKEVLRQCPLALDAIIGTHSHSGTSIQPTTLNLLKDFPKFLNISNVHHISGLFDRSFCPKHSKVNLALFR